MKIETLKSKKKKYFLYALIVGVALLLPLVLSITFGKYQTKESIKLVEGVINYKVPDFKIMAIYQNNEKVNSMPSDGYVIDTAKTYCYVNSSENKIYNLMYTDNYGKHIFDNIDSQSKCYLYFKSATLYTESILNGADPVLKDGLIPVMISDDGTVTKASLYSKWYDYETKNWANAVILEDNSISYDIGETIPEENIESYFVWIPRYKYKIWNTGEYDSYIQLYESGSTTEIVKYDSTTRTYTGNINGSAQTIDVVFENKNTSVSTGSTIDSYLTHPAFTAFNTNGLWVGKFETGYKGAISASAAQVNSSDSSKIVVKPNVYSWRSNTVANMFKAALNYNTSLTSHMMKNTEWGAVAYLSLSSYGTDGEVNINNNSAYLTGYSATANTDQTTYAGTCSPSWGTTMCGTGANVTQSYNTATGYNASTTGNITGVYDMSGGVHEYMAAYKATYGAVSSGFSEDPATIYGAKYFDVYSSEGINTTYSNRILGDATGELGPFYAYKDGDGGSRIHSSWFADNAGFPYSTSPWFGRGGAHYNGVLASQLNFNRATGGADGGIGSRLVLAVG